MEKQSFETIDQYILLQTPEIRAKLNAIRAAIREAAPDAAEKISYQMPTFWQKVNIAHFAAFSRHIGFYPGPEAIEAFRERIAPYRNSKGAVQFPLDRPLPLDLVRDMVRFNLAKQL